MASAIFDAASSGSSSARATSLSWGHTCSGDQRALYVWVLTAENATSTGVTFNGVAMTKLGNWSAGSGVNLALWRLFDPPTGAQTIVASASASCPIIGAAQSISDASQTEDGTWVVETGSGSSDPSNSIAAGADDLVIDAVALEDEQLPTANSGQTTDVRRSYSGFGDNAALGASHEPGATTTTMGWDVPAGTDAWVHVMLQVKPGSVVVDLPLRWSTHAYFNVNLDLRWTTRSHAPNVDLPLRWTVTTPVPVSDLALRWITRSVVGTDLGLAWFTDSKRIPDAPLPVFTTEELLELQVGQRTESVRFEVIDAFQRKLFEIHPDRASTVTVANNINATIKRTLQGIRLTPEEAALVDPVVHRLRPVWELENGAEFPLGVFLFGDASSLRSTAGAMFETTLFDQTFILDQGRRSSYALGVGAVVTDALKDLAREVNMATEGIEDAPTVLANPLAWPAGTSRLRIMNDLAAMASYYSVYFDNTGLLRCRGVPDLEVANAQLRYNLDRTSRVSRDTVVESDDLWEAANVYVVVSTSANQEEVSGSYEIPESNPLSVKNRGYEVVKTIDVQGLETSDEAAARAKAAALQDPSTYRQVEFDAAPDPRHDTFDVVGFDGEVYREQGWTLTCAPGGPHRHALRRVDHIDSITRPVAAAVPPPVDPVVSPPGAPSTVSAVAGNNSATVSFSPPLDNGGAPVTGYTVTSSGGHVATGPSSPITVSGLTNGVSYTFTVTATNSAGTGGPSPATNAVVPSNLTVPGPPVIGTATPGDGRATVQFSPPTSDGGSQITSYTATASPGGRAVTDTGAGSLTITGLDNGTSYTFTVTATNAVGTGPASAPSNAVTPVAADEPPPDAVAPVQSTSGVLLAGLEHVVPFPAAVAGDLLAVAWAPASPLADVGPVPEGWLLAAQVNTGNVTSSVGWYYRVAEGGETSVTFTTGTSVVSSYVAQEWAGLAPVVLDVTSTTQAGAQATSLASTPSSPTTSEEALALAAAVLNNTSGGSEAWTDGFALAGAVERLFAGTKVLAAIGQVSTTASWTSTRWAGLALAVFKKATVIAPRHVVATPAATSVPATWVTWDRSDSLVSAYDVLRDGDPIGTITVSDDAWDDCAFLDVTPSATHSYQVRARYGVASATSVGVLVSTRHQSYYGRTFEVDAQAGANVTERAQTAIDAAIAAGGGVVLFAGTSVNPRTYQLGPLTVANADKVLLVGGGRDATYLQPNFAGDSAALFNPLKLISFTGTLSAIPTVLAAPIAPGDRTVAVTDSAGLEVGDLIAFDQMNPQQDPEAMRAAGVTQDPGTPNDRRFPWDANEVVAINGTSVTFRHPFSQPFTTAVIWQRYSAGRDVGVESMTIQGRSASESTYYRLVDFVDCARVRMADVQTRWANKSYARFRQVYDFQVVGLRAPHAGPLGYGGTGTKYKLDIQRTALGLVVDATMGETLHQENQSYITAQWAQRLMVRHSRFFGSDNYAVNEHGGGSRHWVIENNWFSNCATAAVFLGNTTWGFTGDGIVRNNTFEDNVRDLYLQENTYGVRVLDNVSRRVTTEALYWMGWGQKADLSYSPIPDPALWGSARMVVRGNRWLEMGATAYGLILGRSDSSWYPYLGMRDLIVDGNHFEAFSTTQRSIWLRGDSTTSVRFQIRNTTGSNVGYVKPAFVAGDHWANNTNSAESYGSRVEVDWDDEVFAWELLP